MDRTPGGRHRLSGRRRHWIQLIVNLWLLKHYRPSALSAFFVTQPIFGVVAANILRGEPLTATVLVATVAVIVGIALTNR